MKHVNKFSEFKVIMVLTAVALISVGCAKGDGGSESKSVTAQSVSGEYVFSGKTTAGDVIVLYASLTEGKYESRSYTFKAGNMFMGLYTEYRADDSIDGEIHNANLTYSTCPVINGLTIPQNASFEIRKVDEKKILIDSVISKTEIVFTKLEVGLDKYLNDAGMSVAVEDVGCNGVVMGVSCGANMVTSQHGCLPQCGPSSVMYQNSCVPITNQYGH